MTRPALLVILALSTAAVAQQPSPPASQPAAPATPSATPTAPTQPEPKAGPLAQIPVVDLEARLANLQPSAPEDYFRLAEEVAEEREVPGARDLARRLYVLAYELDRRSTRPAGIAYSACLGLAALSNIYSEKRWLRAVASQVDSRAGDTVETVSTRIDATPVSERAALEISSALGAIRAAEGRRALQLLGRPGNWAILEEYEGVLSAFGGADGLRRHADQWPSCPECHNRRVIGGRGGSPLELCHLCGGIPGPKLSDAELIAQLRLEVSLLRGIHRLWSSQLLADGGEPLRDPNPDDVHIIFRVDPAAVLWRDSKWVPDPNAPKPTATPQPEPPPSQPGSG